VVLLGQVSFVEGMDNESVNGTASVEARSVPTAPEFVGENAVVRHLPTQRDHHVEVGIMGAESRERYDADTIQMPESVTNGSNLDEDVRGEISVSSSSSMASSNASVGTGSHRRVPEPPPMPPPATERERLVERERQARLETERARRRHLALLRERQETDGDLEEDGSDSGRSQNDITLTATHNEDVTPQSVLNQEAIVVSVAAGQTVDADANPLSYTMERFLETLGDDERSEPPVANETPQVESNTTMLPYTMELFLAENVVVGPEGEVEVVPQPETAVDGDDNNGGHDAVSTTLDFEEGIVADEFTNHFRVESPDRLQQHASLNQPVDSLEETTVVQGQVPSSLRQTLSSSSEEHQSTRHSSEQDVTDAVLHQNTSTESMYPPSPSQLEDVIPSVRRSDTEISSPSRQILNMSTESSSNTNPHVTRLTAAGIAQLDVLDNASTGNAAPNSERDEPSESSVIGGGSGFAGHAFSVATQTTVIESVTETSKGSKSECPRAVLNQSSDSVNIILVEGGGSVSAGGSASVEARPSSESNATGGGSDAMTGQSSSAMIESMLQSESNTSSDDDLQLLTEAGIAQLDVLDNVSTGNAPPHSVRDESRLSESSITGRGQLSVMTPITTESESVDDHNSNDDNSLSSQSVMLDGAGNASLEAMPSDDESDHRTVHSIEGMLSEHGDQSFHDINNDSHEDDLVVYQASDMASSTSIEAFIDLGSEQGDMHHSSNQIDHHDYGAVDNLHREQTVENETGTYDWDIESAPLLPIIIEDHCHGFPRALPQDKTILCGTSCLI
jgi:hypothetical protein